MVLGDLHHETNDFGGIILFIASISGIFWCYSGWCWLKPTCLTQHETPGLRPACLQGQSLLLPAFSQAILKVTVVRFDLDWWNWSSETHDGSGWWSGWWSGWCWYINANMTRVYWWDPWSTIYSSTMDPLGNHPSSGWWYFKHDFSIIKKE